jgi:hypothetical protein
MFVLVSQSLSFSNKSASETALYSIGEIINAIPDDADILRELAVISIPICVSFLQEFPEIVPFGEICRLLSFFNSKIDDTNDMMYQTVVILLDIVIGNEPFFASMQDISYVICPIILSPGVSRFPELIPKSLEMAQRFITFSEDEGDYDLRAYALLIAGCLVLAVGEAAFDFVGAFFKWIGDEKPEAGILFSASVFGIAAVLFTTNCGDRKIEEFMGSEVIREVIERIGSDSLQTYKELRMGFLTLLKLAELGVVEAFVTAVKKVGEVVELRMEEGRTAEEKMRRAVEMKEEAGRGAARFPPLVVPFGIPSLDGMDEVAMFVSLLGREELVNGLTSDQKEMIEEIIRGM